MAVIHTLQERGAPVVYQFTPERRAVPNIPRRLQILISSNTAQLDWVKTEEQEELNEAVIFHAHKHILMYFTKTLGFPQLPLNNSVHLHACAIGYETSQHS